MSSSIPTRQTAKLAHHICTACRRQAATRSLSTASRAPAAALVSPTARRPTSAKPLQPLSQRYISHSASRREGQSDATSASDKTASSSVSGSPRPSPPSYYALFPQTFPSGPPPSGPFHIDVPLLRREFLRLQAASHPDFHAHSSATPQSRRQAEAVSALLNGAFKTLSNPLLRAQYLLREQYGLDLAGDEAGSIAEADEDTLDQVLEAREVIEDAVEEKDLERLKEENEGRIRESEERIGDMFGRGDLEGLKREVVRLRYWVNIREGIDNWEPGKGVVLQH